MADSRDEMSGKIQLSEIEIPKENAVIFKDII